MLTRMSTPNSYKTAVPPLIGGTAGYTALRVSNMRHEANDTIKDVQQIDILQAPINPTDGVNKAYVDAQAGGSPGNPDTSVQYNNSGTFAGSATFIYNSGTDTVTMNNATIGGASITSASIGNVSLTTGAIATTPVAGTDIANKDYVDANAGGTPGAPDTSIQYNNAGTFAGSANLTYNSGTDTVSMTNLNASDAALTTGTISTTPVAGTDIANKNYVDAATGSAPGGPAQAVQFNSNPAGVFSGSSDFSWDDTLKVLTVNGTILADDYNTSSTMVMKSNIEPLHDPLGKLRQIEGKSYNFKDQTHKTYGVIAEELEQTENKDLVREINGYKRVDYMQMIPMLVEGFKKLEADNQELRAKLEKRPSRRRRRSKKTFKN